MCDAFLGPMLKAPLAFTITLPQRPLPLGATTIIALLLLLSSFAKFHLGAKLSLGEMLGRSRKEPSVCFLSFHPFSPSPYLHNHIQNPLRTFTN